jgi:hypothetical protein
LKIELLHFEGCPGFIETLGILHRVIAEAGLMARIVPVVLGPGDRSDFSGSPSILVDGEDLFSAGRSGRTMSCRIYFTPKGSKNHPTAAMVREALAVAKLLPGKVPSSLKASEL